MWLLLDLKLFLNFSVKIIFSLGISIEVLIIECVA